MRTSYIAIVVFGVVLAAAGCHKNTPTASDSTIVVPPVPTVPAPPPPIPPGPEPLPRIDPPPAPISVLEAANQAFVAGNYDEAERGYEKVLQDPLFYDQRDSALYHLGLIRALRPTPPADRQRAVATLKQLIEEFPESPFVGPATAIVSLTTQVTQTANDVRALNQKVKALMLELDRLKKIDADRSNRP